ncbi:MAG: hypothetical protein M0Z36_06200 [Thermaerobacter sp.]|nr:hypothetical protein [Thermaerobacter sp.]
MATRIHQGWKLEDIEAVVLENAHLRLDVLVGMGCKIYNVWDRVSGHNLLWHHPRRRVERAPFGANFDDWWAGGWDDPFPNGAPTTFGGDDRPYLGELWTRPWNFTIEGADSPSPVLHVWTEGVITPARVDKWIQLDPDRPVMTVRYRVTNLQGAPIEFMLGIHPALTIDAGYRIDVPAKTVQVEESRGGALGKPGKTYTWPMVADSQGNPVDLRKVPGAHAQCYGFAYATALSAGWLALSAPDDRPGFALAFDPLAFPTVWLWLVYGGWRGLYHVALEPWTSFPSRMDVASQEGRTVTLAAGARWETAVTAVVHRGWQQIDQVTTEGEIRGQCKEGRS